MPEAACPHRCVFCNQHSITNRQEQPTDEQITDTITSYLKTRRPSIERVEVGFFGGNFTGLPEADMRRVLKLVQPWILSGEVHAIRVSTRPDYIDERRLTLLKEMNVETIEMGVQSFRDKVLLAAGRGHTAADSERASAMILRNGFRLGHQLMIGLPGEEPGDEIFNAQESVRQGASDIRIYPVLVLRDTELEVLYITGKYRPLTLEEAVEKASRMMNILEADGRNIIKVGLHPSESFAKGDLIAGPWHPNFRELLSFPYLHKAGPVNPD